MTREEALNIKDEILKKEGSIHILRYLNVDGVVLIKDINDKPTEVVNYNCILSAKKIIRGR